MKFLDQAKIHVQSGAGGNGCLSFRREAFVEFGGPDGGDGGRGGHVVVEAVAGLNTLIDFRYRRHYKAGRGQHGMGRNRTGATGKDIVLKVPAGTQIFDEDQEFMMADLTRPGETVVLLEGGRGGLGNSHFKSSTNRAPRQTTPGGQAQEMYIVLRLKLLADAGLIGLPNAGKSTFLAAVTRAKPKIAAYPFTTLRPQLGVVGLDDTEFVLADIPGLIEGAHDGVGLGDRFLGHVERCGVLLHLIDGTADDPVAAYRTVRAELAAYGAGLEDKTELVGLNKIDSLGDQEIADKLAALRAVTDSPVHALSGVAGTGVREVVAALAAQVAARRPAPEADAEAGEAADTDWSPL